MPNIPSFLSKNLLHLIKGSSLHVITQMAAIALGFISSFLVAKYFGAALVGNIATITSLFSLLGLLSLVGNQSLALKVVPQQLLKGGYLSASITYKRLLINSTYASIILISVWILVELHLPFTLLKGLESYLYLTALLIIINVFFILNGKILRGLGDYKYFTLLDFLPAAFSLCTVIIAITLNISGENYLLIHFLPRLVLVALAFYLVRNLLRKINVKEIAENTTFPTTVSTPTKRYLLRTSVPMLGITISTASIAHLDILMLNHFSSPTVVGVYSIYVKFAGVAAMATVSINAMFAPKIAALHTEENHKELKTFSKNVTLLLFSAVVGLTTLLLLIHRPLLAFYGPQFLSALPALYILLISNAVMAFFGSFGFFLNMTGHQNSFFWIILAAAVLNAMLNYIFIPTYGIHGAAIATLLATLVSSVLATFKIKAINNYTLIWTGK